MERCLLERWIHTAWHAWSMERGVAQTTDDRPTDKVNIDLPWQTRAADTGERIA